MSLPTEAFRDERAWNLVSRWIDRHKTVRKIKHLIYTYLKVGSVRTSGSGGQPVVDVRYGGASNGEGEDHHDFDLQSAVMEQHGFAGCVGVGARAAVFRQGALHTRTLAFGVRRPTDRPTWLEDWEVCAYSPFQQRVALRADGSLTVEAGLADYRTDGADQDEGSKLRLAKAGEIGEVELYGEANILVRSQAAGGSGPKATALFEADGTVTLGSDDGGPKATLKLQSDGTFLLETESDVTVNSQGKITATATGDIEAEAGGVLEIRNADGATVRLDGANVIVTPGAAGEVRLGGSAGLDFVSLATAVNTELVAIVGGFNTHSHAALGGPPGSLLAPPGSTASSNTKAKT